MLFRSADLVPVKVNLWPIGSSVPKISALPFKSWYSHQRPLASSYFGGGRSFTSTVVPNATSNRHSRNLAISYVFSASGSTGVESCAVKFENGWPIGSPESWRPGTDILASMMIYLALILCFYLSVLLI